MSSNRTYLLLVQVEHGLRNHVRDTFLGQDICEYIGSQMEARAMMDAAWKGVCCRHLVKAFGVSLR